MTETVNFKLNKPESTDPIRVADFNANADIIDVALGALTGRSRVVVGSYTGDNTAKHTVPLGFTPKFFLVVSKLNDKPYLTIATPEIGVYFSGSSFTISESRCVEGGVYISGNSNYSSVGNYYLAVE